MDELNHLGWVVNRTYEIGGTVFGVRTNVAEMDAWLEEALGAYASDDTADPYYSIMVAAETRVGSAYHILYQESKALLRSFELAEVCQALLDELEAFLFPGRDDALYLSMGAARVDGVTVLMPQILIPYLDTLGRRVERAGVALPRQMYTAIECDGGTLVPIHSALAVPEGVLAWLEDVDGSSVRPRTHAPAAIDAVCFNGLDDAQLVDVPPGFAAYKMALHAKNLDVLGDRGLTALGLLANSAACFELRAFNTRETLDSLLAAAGAVLLR